MHCSIFSGPVAYWPDGTSRRSRDDPELDTAEILRSCALFLSFSEHEGFGLPPAEAMACGAFVVGYTGMAGRDFFDPAYCSPIGDGDLLAYAQAVEAAIGRYESDPASLAAQGIQASHAVLARYTIDNLRQDLATFYTSLTTKDASCLLASANYLAVRECSTPRSPEMPHDPNR